MQDIIIDIETLSTKRKAVIVSIAAVLCDVVGGNRGAKLHLALDVQEQLDNGYVVDGSTLAFWLKQETSARSYAGNIIEGNTEGIVTRAVAMGRLYDFIKGAGPQVQVWGNGISFDLGMLHDDLVAYCGELPWQFRNERDVRTVLDTHHRLTGKKATTPIIPGTIKHHPVDDCLYELGLLHSAFKGMAEVPPLQIASTPEAAYSWAEDRFNTHRADLVADKGTLGNGDFTKEQVDKAMRAPAPKLTVIVSGTLLGASIDQLNALDMRYQYVPCLRHFNTTTEFFPIAGSFGVVVREGEPMPDIPHIRNIIASVVNPPPAPPAPIPCKQILIIDGLLATVVDRMNNKHGHYHYKQREMYKNSHVDVIFNIGGDFEIKVNDPAPWVIVEAIHKDLTEALER